MNNMKKTKIICTMGPTTSDRAVVKELALNGMDIARFNFSHGSHAEQKERMDMINHVITDLDNVSCDVFDGLLVDFAKNNGATVIIKGLRTVSDFEYEFQMALLNKALNPEYETMFMMTNTKFSYISSSMVKEVAKFHGGLDGLVPPYIAEKIKSKYKNK